MLSLTLFLCNISPILPLLLNFIENIQILNTYMENGLEINHARAQWVRDGENYPQYARPWEYLAGEMKKIAIKRGDPIYTQSYKHAISKQS